MNTTTTQAISQIGGNISSQVIGSRNLSLSGLIYQNVDTVKQKLIDTFIPFVEGVLTIKEIAGYVGYPDYNYFSKVFRSYAGVSPLEYRRQHMKKK